MNKKIKWACIVLLSVGAVVIVALLLRSSNIAVLNPKGSVGIKQRDLLTISTLLMLIVVIPVFVLTFIVSWKYKAGNANGKYTPNWNKSHLAEAIWWGVPLIIIVVLGVITWKSSHALDPYKPLDANTKPLKIQVVALNWKWLFIYPDYNIATVNFIQFPTQTQVCFEITGEGPMNSFWIPQLGGQIFAMAGMRTKLHLIADEAGKFKGCSANLSGHGFSGMTFTAEATSQEDFEDWVHSVQQVSERLDLNEYNQLLIPSEYHPAAFYVLDEQNLFDGIIMKYMMPMSHTEEMHHGSSHG